MIRLIIWISILFLNTTLISSDKSININFNDLSIQELIKITSKITKRNILITKKIEGKVDFISQTPLNKEELLALLLKVLNSRNFTLIEDGNILIIVPLVKKQKKKKISNRQNQIKSLKQ